MAISSAGNGRAMIGNQVYLILKPNPSHCTPFLLGNPGAGPDDL